MDGSHSMDAVGDARFREDVAKVAGQFRSAREAGEPVRLAKPASNLFRRRQSFEGRLIDISGLDRVLAVDAGAGHADIGGMTPYDAVVEATLREGRMPAVVPELKSITVGGAVTGGGIESSSFRYGFAHETVLEMEILTASGELVLCRPDNAYSDLFYGFANSYGTLGYAVRLRIVIVPVKPFVRLRHERFENADDYFSEMERVCRAARGDPEGAAFVDGTVFREGECYRTIGEWTDHGGGGSNYRFMRPYYRSIREKKEDCLSVADYLWRWDTDWFWCARGFGMENPVLRFLFGMGGGLNSRTYWKLIKFYQGQAWLQRLTRGREKEWVIQDVEIPADRSAEFQKFLHASIRIYPFWICPTMAFRDSSRYPLYRTDPETLYINFGFWGRVEGAPGQGHYNRLVEEKVAELGGKKSLYSESYFDEATFWSHYNESAYRALKARYDPDGFFPDLYEKCVGRR